MEALEYINEYIHWAKFVRYHVKVYATVKRMLITKSYIKVDSNRLTKVLSFCVGESFW